MTLAESIVQVLSEAQSSLHHHQRLLKTLKAVQDKHGLEEFFQAFFQPFSNVLVVYKREPAAERVIDFVAKYAVSVAPKCEEDSDDSDSRIEEDQTDVDDGNFLTLLLARLLSLHEARDKAVRFRVCQLVGRLLSCAGDSQCSVPSELLESTQTVMLERAYDKVPVVRVHAVAALELLQDGDNPQCPVVSTLLELLRGDSSPEVRRSAISKILVTNSTLQAVIERTRDVKDVNRREAFLRLSEKCKIRHLSIHQRIRLLSDGLNDRSGLVQEACVRGLLRSWSLSLDGDFLSLLSRLDVESSSEVAELALEKLFDDLAPGELVSSLLQLMAGCSQGGENWEKEIRTPGRPVEDSGAAPSPAAPQPVVRVIPQELLKCEEAFYWSCLCRYFHKKGVKGEESLEQIVPTLSEFCDYIQRYVASVLLVQEGVERKMQAQFVARQLFSIISVLDLSDEVGRRRLGQLVCDLLVMPGFPAALTEPLLAEQTTVWPQQAFRIEKLTEVIADIRQPPSLELTCQASGDQSQLLGGLVESTEHPETLLRSLAIACELAKELPGGRKLSPALQMLVQTLLFPCIQNENPYVRDMALNCLGLVCLLDIATARNHLLLFLQVSQVDHESVQATALKVIFDLLHVFGFEAFNAGEESSSSSSSSDTGQPGGETQDCPGESGEGETPVGEEEPSSEVETEEPGSPSGEEVQDERTAADSTTQRILNIMAEFLEGESPLLRVVAAEGLAKLLLSGRVLSPKLVAKLLVLWYNPTMQEEDRLRAALGAFFPSFAASDRSCRECLGEVYMPVMRMLFEAPPTSPLASINAGNMADFLIHLTVPAQPSEDSVHDSLAHAVASAVLSDPSDSTTVRVYCRSLNQMQLTASNQSNAAELSVLLEQMLQEVTDRTGLQYLKKFGSTLKTINPSCCTNEWMSPESDSRPATPPHKGSKTQQRAKAKSTAKKATAVQSTRKKNEVTFRDECTSSDEENVEPEISSHPLERTMTSRLSKSVAVSRMAAGVVAAMPENEVGEQSDDSLELVGEHSPFIKHTGNRRKRNTKPLKMLQFSDED